MRKLLLFVAVLFAAIQVSAAPVDEMSAQATAQQFIQQNSNLGRLRAPIRGQLDLIHVEKNSKRSDLAAFYIFNTPNGYVVVSGDDRSEQILGYGDYPLNYDEIPCNMKALLSMLREQIEFLQAHPDLKVEAPTLKKVYIPSVDPLLTALWDQEAPYWNKCVINGYQCLTGCPATSAAMVFHYWKYPDYETPAVPAYRCKLSTTWSWWGSDYTEVNVAALPPVTFDWDNMRNTYGSSSNSYTAAEADAVATLMRYIGQAERMEYGTSMAGGSGVHVDSVSLIADAFKLFGYDEETVRVVKKTSAYSGGQTLYSNDEWAALIQEELIEGRPIVFCAVGDGGHAFNVDGYNADNDKYHINFGWSGEDNNYYALNSFNGFNQYQQMVIGIQPPIKSPRLKSDANSLSMACFKNQTATQTFKLTGRNLEGPVTITLNDENGVFSIDQTSLTPDEDGKMVQTVVVTYAPKTEGDYSATVVASTPNAEDVVITLTGTSVYELYRPEMLPVDEATVTATSFRADWNDATPAENVTSYTLEVRVKPDVCLLTEGDWSGVPQESTNHASNATNYLPEGWTFSGTKFYLDGGFISASYNSVITANCDMSAYNKVSIIIKAKAYTQGNNTALTIKTAGGTKTLMLSKEVKTYLVVLDTGDGEAVTFTCGNFPEIQSIKIYGGEITDPEPFSLRGANVTGDADFCLIEGITPDKFYTVTGLTPATSYLYRVKALYVNGTESSWSNTKEVALPEGASFTRGDANGDGRVDISDVSFMINACLNAVYDGMDFQGADCDGDGEVNINDVIELINFIMSGTWD